MNRIKIYLIFLIYFFLKVEEVYSQKVEEKYFLNGSIKESKIYDSISGLTHVKEFYNSGIVFKEGNLKSNKKMGIWLEYDYEFLPNSKNIESDAEYTIITSNYQNDTLEGRYAEKSYYYNKKNPKLHKILSGSYKKGKKEGEWKRYGIYKNDSVVNLYMGYIDNEQVSRMEWIPNLKAWVFNEYSHGKIYGNTLEYYKNSRRKFQGRKETLLTTDSLELTYPTGVWTYFDTAGKIQKYEVYDGYTVFFPYLCHLEVLINKKGKKITEGRLIESNQKDGKWFTFDTSGKLSKTDFYINGKRLDSNLWRGKQIFKIELLEVDSAFVPYINGLRNGTATFFVDSLLIKVDYKNDFLNGSFSVFEKNQLKCDGLFSAGKREGKFKIYQDKKVIREIIYSSGILKEEKIYTKEGIFVETISYPIINPR